MTCAGCSAYILPTALCEVQVTVFKLFRGGFEIFFNPRGKHAVHLWSTTPRRIYSHRCKHVGVVQKG